MNAKLQNLGELSKLLEDKDAVSRELLSLSGKFQLGSIARQSGFKKEKGIPYSALLVYLLLIRICKISVFRFYKANFFGLLDNTIGKNCFYRFINNENLNWRKFLYSTAKSYRRLAEKTSRDDQTAKQDVEELGFFILDDTTIQKTGMKMENIGKVFDHTTGEYVLGYKALTLSYFDGKGFVPVDFSVHVEPGKDKRQGLSAKQLLGRFSKKRDTKSHGHKRLLESLTGKPKVAIEMLKRAWKNGFRAAYFLCDSWFDGEDFIRQIRGIGNGTLHVLCMAKNGNRKYKDGGRLHTIKQMVALNERNAKSCRKYKCLYFKKDVMLDDVPVRLFVIKYGRNQRWNVLLTTDTSLSFVKAFEYYQIRWNTEVMYRECKQHLGLGRCQSNDFDALIADTTLTFATYTMLALYKRVNEYETMGALFRSLQEEVFAVTLWQRFLPVIEKILRQLCDLLDIDFQETMKTVCTDKGKAGQIFRILRTLDKDGTCVSVA